ncbi:MAG: uroporphyrinogen decarboxylase family protein [Thermoguttaceae bacterium]
MPMTSRERIICALNHKQPDAVPLDLGAHRSSGMMVQAYVKLRRHLNLPVRDVYLYDIIQQLALIDDDVLDRFGVDVIDVGHDYIKNPEYWQDFTMHDGTRCKIPSFFSIEPTNDGYVARGDEGQIICIQKKDCLYFEQTCFPLANTVGKEIDEDETFAQLPYHLNQIMWCKLGTPPAPAGFDDAGIKIRRESAKALRASTDRAIYGTFGGNLLEIGEYAFRIDGFLHELAAAPSRAHKFLDRLLEMHLENLNRYLDAVGDEIDIIGFGDDFGMQTGPQISPKMYRTFFQPRQKEMWDCVKRRKPHLKIVMHCCGGVYPLLRGFIEAGLDGINPVQFTCKDMELERLKREFGSDLTFWGGGCDTRHFLPRGTPSEIRDHVRSNIETMSAGGGFVFQQVHNIMADVPPENIVAMLDAVR